jgi:ribosomal protein L32
MRTLYKKLRDGVAKIKVDNAKLLGYKTGMMGPGEGEEEHGQRQNKKTRAWPKQICPTCGSSSLSKITSKHCPAYTKNKEKNKETDGREGVRQPGTEERWKCVTVNPGQHVCTSPVIRTQNPMIRNHSQTNPTTTMQCNSSLIY